MALFMALAHTQRRRELYPLVLILVFSAVLSGDLLANLWDKIKSTVDKDDQQEQTLKKYFPCGESFAWALTLAPAGGIRTEIQRVLRGLHL